MLFLDLYVYCSAGFDYESRAELNVVRFDTQLAASFYPAAVQVCRPAALYRNCAATVYLETFVKLNAVNGTDIQ